MKTGQVKPSFLIGSWKEAIVCRANDNTEAFNIAAFSLSRNPRLATVLLITTSTSPSSLFTISAARSSCFSTESIGAKMPLMTMLLIPFSLMILHCSTISSSRMSEIRLPSTSRPPFSKAWCPRMRLRKGAGQSMHGGACLLKGAPRRRTATRERRVRSRVTTALTKWVVPIVTLATDVGSTEADWNMVVMASAIPWLGSVVVGALCLAEC